MAEAVFSPLSDTSSQASTDSGDLRGWEGLSEWTGGLPPEQIEPLASVRELEPVYPLLHALVGRSSREFFARAAALETLVSSTRAAFRAEDLEEVLWWLAEPARGGTLRALRQSGWLSFDPAAGYALTDAGRWAHDVLVFLHKRLHAGELLLTVEGVRYAVEIGLDPLWHLQSMRSRLVALREEIDAALASHSEVVLRRTAGRLDQALQLSGRIRAYLDLLPLDHLPARRVAREIHDLLSRLLGAGAELHAAITEVGRQYLHLTAGLTTEQIVRALMDRSREELAEAAREALLPALPPPPLLTTEALAQAAELQALRSRPESEPVRWEEPPEPPRAADLLEVPPEVERLLADLAAVARGTAPAPLARVVAAPETGESFLRASLLSLAGFEHAGEGVAGRLGALALVVDPEGDGWPEPLGEVHDAGAPAGTAPAGPPAALSRLTPGWVRPRA